MNRANNDIRNKAKSYKVKLWQIAAALQISDVTFTKKMRFELPEAEKERIMNVIEEIAQEQEADNNE